MAGLVGIADPPRAEAIEAISAARRAGIRTVMITGDHPVTASAIARELGIWAPPEDPAPLVHARATPEDKVRIVREWKGRGAVVAMTGDGVNDAPAIREAHVGISMGRGGTEVAREASAIVITDDDFASIVAGVREGRAIYENIRKTIAYLLTGNAAELLIMLSAALLGLALPLLPLHLLWVNLLTDGLPALALAMDPPDADLLARPPRDPKRSLLGTAEWARIGVTAAIEAAVVLAVFATTLDGGVELARTMAFSTLVFSELTRSFAMRSERRVLFEVGAASNRALVAVVVVSGALQLALLHVPWVARVFGLAPLTAVQTGLAIACGLVPVTLLELRKLLARLGGTDRAR
jgi:Ca2+-transporting ATPase